jgi:hypothetical protein
MSRWRGAQGREQRLFVHPGASPAGEHQFAGDQHAVNDLP